MTAVEEDVDDRFAGIDIDSLLNRENRKPLGLAGRKTLYEPPEFIHRLCGEETVLEGQSCVLECKVRGFPAPTLRWFKDDEEIVDHPRIHWEGDGKGGYALMLDNINKGDEAAYRCRAENVEGQCSCFFFLSVKGKRRSKKRKKDLKNSPNKRTVSFPPMFSTIVEKVEEEEKQGKEFESLPPSPMTDFYYALTLKGRQTWPSFVGDWAFTNGAHHLKSNEHRRTASEQGDRDNQVSIPNGGDTYNTPSSGRAAARRSLRRSDLAARVEAKKQRAAEENKRKEKEERVRKEEEEEKKKAEEEKKQREELEEIKRKTEEREEEEARKRQEAMKLRRKLREERMLRELKEEEKRLKEEGERRLKQKWIEEKRQKEEEERREQEEKRQTEEEMKKMEEVENNRKMEEEMRKREEYKQQMKLKQNEEKRKEEEVLERKIEEERKMQELEKRQKEEEQNKIEEQERIEEEKTKGEEDRKRALEEKRRKEEDEKKKPIEGERQCGLQSRKEEENKKEEKSETEERQKEREKWKHDGEDQKRELAKNCAQIISSKSAKIQVKKDVTTTSPKPAHGQGNVNPRFGKHLTQAVVHSKNVSPKVTVKNADKMQPRQEEDASLGTVNQAHDDSALLSSTQSKPSSLTNLEAQKEELKKRQQLQKEELKRKQEEEERKKLVERERKEKEELRRQFKKEQVRKEQLRRMHEEEVRQRDIRQHREDEKRKKEEGTRNKNKENKNGTKASEQTKVELVNESEFEVKVYKRDYSFADLRKTLEAQVGGDIINPEEHKYWDSILEKHDYSINDIRKSFDPSSSLASSTLERKSRMRVRRNSIELETEIVKIKRSSSITDLRESYTKSLDRPKKKTSEEKKRIKDEEFLKRTPSINSLRQQFVDHSGFTISSQNSDLSNSAETQRELGRLSLTSPKDDSGASDPDVKEVKRPESSNKGSPGTLNNHPELTKLAVNVAAKRASFHEIVSQAQQQINSTELSIKAKKRMSVQGFDSYGGREIPVYRRVAGWSDDIGASPTGGQKSQQGKSQWGTAQRQYDLQPLSTSEDILPGDEDASNPRIRPFVYNSMRTIARRFSKKD